MLSFDERLAIFFAGLMVSVGCVDPARDAGVALRSSRRFGRRAGVYGGVCCLLDRDGASGVSLDVEHSVSIILAILATLAMLAMLVMGYMCVGESCVSSYTECLLSGRRVLPSWVGDVS